MIYIIYIILTVNKKRGHCRRSLLWSHSNNLSQICINTFLYIHQSSSYLDLIVAHCLERFTSNWNFNAEEYKNSLFFSREGKHTPHIHRTLTEMASGITCEVRARSTVIYTLTHGSCPTLLQCISTGSTTEALKWLTVPQGHFYTCIYFHCNSVTCLAFRAKEFGFCALLRRMLTVATKSIQPPIASLSQLKWVFKLGNFLLRAGFSRLPL